MRKKLISMSIICTSLTVRTQPSPRFHVKSVVTLQEPCNGLLRLKLCKNLRTTRLGQNLLVLMKKKCVYESQYLRAVDNSHTH